jgi:hypothetical protein
MRTSTLRAITMATLTGLLASGASAQETGAKIISVSDEGDAFPGRSTVEDYQGALPRGESESRATQMPGWPVTVGLYGNYNPSRGLVFADLNGDGPLELIASSTDRKLYAWDHTATPVAGFPVNLIGMAQYPPSVADLDGDGDIEIVQFTRGITSGGRFYIVDHQGSVLPGFPIAVGNNNLAGSAALFDLDNDGVMEILVPERSYPLGSLHVFEIDGTEWGGGWPVTLDHVPTGSPAIGDVDNDGLVEIAYLSYDSIYLLEVDGTNLAGWPKQIPNLNFSYQSPAFADLDGDGDREIVVGGHMTAAGCYVFHHDGTSFPGWPKILGSWTYCSPTVTDLEGDGELEILDGRAGGVSGTSNCFWAWTAAGVAKPGFPYRSSLGGGSEGPLVVADIDNDGTMEIFADYNVTVSGDGYVFGVDSSGNDLAGFPLRPRGFTYMNGVTVGDVDGDGDIDLAVLSAHDTGVDVNLYDLAGTYHPSNVSWEVYHQRSRRGGLHRGEDRLHIQGSASPGGALNFYVHGDPGQLASLYASEGVSANLFPAFGWVWLDLYQLLPAFIRAEVIPPSGEVVMSLSIPNDPVLLGLGFYFQGLVEPDPLGGNTKTTNILRRTIQ